MVASKSTLNQTTKMQLKPTMKMTYFKQFECFKQTGMHFIHLNIRYLLPIISELRLLASKSKPAVICVTEIWLHHSVLDGELSIDGYSILRKDRCRTGGSVRLYIHSNYIFFSKLPDLNNMISWKQ